MVKVPWLPLLMQAIALLNSRYLELRFVADESAEDDFVDLDETDPPGMIASLTV